MQDSIYDTKISCKSRLKSYLEWSFDDDDFSNELDGDFECFIICEMLGDDRLALLLLELLECFELLECLELLELLELL